MAQLAIIADDLTGAADAAGAFASAGLSTIVSLVSELPVEVDVVSISTNSRDRSAVEAGELVTRAAGCLLRSSSDSLVIYKKMDSALRGHPAVELMAALRALGADRAVVAPALPNEGRTTVDGRVLSDGVPLEATPFGKGLISSDLLTVFGDDLAGIPMRLLGRSDAIESVFDAPGIVVADASTDSDLDRIARAVLRSGIRLLCGSAGLARAIARVGGMRSTLAGPPAVSPRAGPILSIVGSRHESSARQVDFACRRGVTVLRPDQVDLDHLQGSSERVRSAVEIALRDGNHVLVTTSGMRHSPLGPRAVAERLAAIVDSPAVRERIGGLVLTGGDVAAAVCSRADARAILLSGEVRPAIPYGRFLDGALAGMPVATKAGSFGASDTLMVCIEALSTLGTSH